MTNITQDATTTRTHIMMTLAGKVEMTKTDFIRPTLSTILSDVGGSLGLWLGLGALQALELLVHNSVLLANRIRERKNKI